MKKRRGYVTVEVDVSEDVYISDIIDQIDDEDLIDEVKERKLEPEFMQITNPKIDYNSVCDLLGVNYHTPVPKLMIELELYLTR